MGKSVYDDECFFEKYSKMERSVKGLAGAGEWETLERLLPDFHGKRVLDLGCGFGWHCQYAVEHGARSVVGVDLSRRMLAVAREKTSGEIRYLRESIEDAAFDPGSFDAVISSLAFHYIPDFRPLAYKVWTWLDARGEFVFSAEHPVFTAYGSQDWIYDTDGCILHFPVDNYFTEGERSAVFLGERVTKYHRTLSTYMDALLQCGFEITGFAEPQPPLRLLDAVPGMRDELRRPMMLILAAGKRPGAAE